MSLESPALAGGFFTISTTWETQRVDGAVCVQSRGLIYLDTRQTKWFLKVLFCPETKRQFCKDLHIL